MLCRRKTNKWSPESNSAARDFKKSTILAKSRGVALATDLCLYQRLGSAFLRVHGSLRALSRLLLLNDISGKGIHLYWHALQVAMWLEWSHWRFGQCSIHNVVCGSITDNMVCSQLQSTSSDFPYLRHLQLLKVTNMKNHHMSKCRHNIASSNDAVNIVNIVNRFLRLYSRRCHASIGATNFSSPTISLGWASTHTTPKAMREVSRQSANQPLSFRVGVGFIGSTQSESC